MTPQIKVALASKPFTKDTYADLFKHADEVWLKNGGETSAPATVVAAMTSSTSSSGDQQVSAVNRGRGRGQQGPSNRGRGARGRGSRGSYNSGNPNRNQPSSSNAATNQKAHQKGPKAAPDVPDNACARHWKEGRNATYCSDPLVCDWVKIIAPRSTRP